MGAEALTLCMIVKNEERVLARCLDSTGGLASEVIMVDTGSTDQTTQIAASYGARVIAFDFVAADFAGARNRALEHASGRWILTLDADEILDSASRPLILELVARDENAGYYFQRVNHSHPEGQPMARTAGLPMKQGRHQALNFTRGVTRATSSKSRRLRAPESD